MSSIDKRIVQMRFENGQFERDAKTTMDTLGKLDAALRFTGTKTAVDSFKTLQTTINQITFSKLESEIENLNSKFTAAGIAWQQMVRTFTDTAMSIGTKAVKSVLDPIIGKGWSRATNIDRAKFQLEGLGIKWEEIQEDINYGVQDTAYGLDAAALAASQLVASGVKFGEVWGGAGNSPMSKALLAISGVAAMTNSSYEDMSRIFTSVAGQGKLMTIQLRQLELRGLNVAAKIGESLGKSEAEVREMVTDGLIDFSTFSEAMYEQFGEHAKAANKTLEGAMANYKAALGRIGADFAAPIRKNLIPIFNTLKDRAKEIKTIMTEQGVYTTFETAIEKLTGSVLNFLENLDTSKVAGFFKAIASGIDAITKVVPVAISWLDRTTYYIRSFGKELISALNPFTNFVDTFKKGVFAFHGEFKSLGDILTSGDYVLSNIIERSFNPREDIISSVVSKVKGWYDKVGEIQNEKLNDIESVAKRIIRGEFGNGEERVKLITDLYGEYTKYQNKVDELLNSGTSALAKEDKTNSIKLDNIKDKAKSLTSTIKSLSDSVTDMSLEELDKVAERIIAGEFGNGVDRIEKLTAQFGSAEKFQDRVNALLSGEEDKETKEDPKKTEKKTDKRISKAKQQVKEVIDIMGTSGPNKLQTSLMELVAVFYRCVKAGSRIIGVLNAIYSDEEKAEMINKLSTAFSGFINILTFRLNVVNGILAAVAQNIRPIIYYLGKIGVNVLSGFGNIVSRVFDKLTSGLSLSWKAGNLLNKVLGFIVTGLKNIEKFTSGGIFAKVGDVLEHIIDLALKGITWLKEQYKLFQKTEGYERLAKIVEGVKNRLVSAFSKIIELITSATDAFLGFDPKFPDLTKNGFIQNVSDFIVKITDKIEWLSKKLGSIFNGEPIYNGNSVIEYLNPFENISLGKLQSPIDSLISFFKGEISVSDLKTKIIDYFKLVGSKIGNIVKSIDFTEILSAIGTGLHDAIFGTKVSAGTLDELFGNPQMPNAVSNSATSSLQNIVDNIKIDAIDFTSLLDKLHKWFKELISNFVDTLTSADSPLNSKTGRTAVGLQLLLAKVVTLLLGGLSLEKWKATIAKNISKILKQISKSGISSGIKKIFGEVDRILKTFKKGLDKTSKAYASKIKAEKWNEIGSAILKVAAAIGIIAVAFYLVSTMDEGAIKKGTEVMVAITACVLAIAAVVGVFGVLKAAFSKGPKNQQNGVVDEVSTFVQKLGKEFGGAVEKFLKKLGKVGTLIAVGYAISKVGEVFLKFVDIPWKKIKRGIVGVGAVIVEIVAAFGALTLINKLGGDDANFNLMDILAILAIARVVTKVANAIIELAKVDTVSLANATTALGEVLLSVSTLAAMSSDKDFKLGNLIDYSSEHSVWPILSYIGMIIAVAEELKSLAYIDSNALSQASDAYVSVLDSISLMMAATGVNNWLTDSAFTETLPTLGGIGALIAEIAGLLALMTELDTDAVLGMAESLSKIMDSMSILAIAIGVFKTKGQSSLTGLASGGAAASGGVLSSVGATVSEFAPIALITAAVTAIAGVLAILDENVFGGKLSWFIDKAVPVIEETVRVLSRLVGIILEEGLLKPIANAFGNKKKKSSSGFLDGFKNLCDTITDLVKTDVPNDTTSIKNLSKMFKSVAKAGFWGFISTLFSKFTDNKQLISVLDNLKTFARKIKEYQLEAADIDSNKLETTSNAIHTITEYCNDINGITLAYDTDFDDSPLGKFAANIIEFAGSMSLYSQKISGIDSEAITKTSEAIETVSKYANDFPNIHDENSVLGKLIGSNDMSKLGESLLDFADKIVVYSEKIIGLKTDNVTKTNKAVKTIIALAKNVPNLHGKNTVLGFLIGNNLPSKFGSTLEGFASGLVTYSIKIKELKTEAVQSTADSVAIITDLASNLPSSGGLVAVLFGNSDPKTFGESMEAFANGITSYAYMMKGAPIEEAIGQTGKLETLIDEYAAFVQRDKSKDDTIFANQDNWGSLAVQISGAATQIKNLSSVIQNELVSDMDSVNRLRSVGTELYETIMDGFENGATFSKDDPLDRAVEVILSNIEDDFKMAGNIETISESMRQLFTTAFDSGDVTSTEEGTTGGAVYNGFLELFGKIYNSANENKDKINQVFEQLLKDIQASIDKINPMFEEIEAASKKNTDDTVANVKKIGEEVQTPLDDMVSQFKTTGEQSGSGMAIGIRSKITTVRVAAAALAKAALTSAQNTLVVRSPSRKFIWLGAMSGLGLAKGLLKFINLIRSNSVRLGMSAIDALKGTISRKNTTTEILNPFLDTIKMANMLLDDKLNTNPVISPVIDMTNIRKANGILSSYRFGSSLNVSSTINGDRRSIPEIQKVSFDDSHLVRAIGDVKTSVTELKRSISSIKLVLDSGTVAGEITDSIDMNLGSIQKYKNRWA